MPFYRCIPQNNENLKNQVELSDVTDEEFKAAYASPKFTCSQIFVQILFFIFGLGWLRLILMIMGTIVYAVIMIPCHAFCGYSFFKKYLYGFGCVSTRRYARFLMFMCGIVYIKKVGKIDENARVFVYNHVSILDGPSIFVHKPFTVIVTAAAKYVPIFGQILYGSGSAFIDRTKTLGNSKIIANIIKDRTMLPVCIAPEGKISNGDILFEFRTGSFLTDEAVQCVTVRYHQLFAYAGTTHNWVVDGFFHWLWLALCVPFAGITLTFLPTFSSEVLANKSPKERAKMCQLAIANSLGTKAINRSSKSIFGLSESVDIVHKPLIP